MMRWRSWLPISPKKFGVKIVAGRIERVEGIGGEARVLMSEIRSKKLYQRSAESFVFYSCLLRGALLAAKLTQMKKFHWRLGFYCKKHKIEYESSCWKLVLRKAMSAL